jgi:hypothetical protein
MDAIQIILIAALGSSLQELLHWYELREHLDEARYRKLIRSVSYWVVTGLMVVGSGVAVWLWFSDTPEVPARQYIVLGAALPLLFKKSVEALTAKKETAGGAPGKDLRTASLRDYFQVGGVRQERLA